jgi:Ca-activated chloride channel family protein
MFRFASPWLLLLLPAAIAASWLMARRRLRADARCRLPLAAAVIPQRSSFWVWLERFLPWLRALVLILIVLALARPQAGAVIENVSSHGVDIVVALDISGSMAAEDFTPDNRLAVAKHTVETFIDWRSSDRIGLVAFAGLATTRCPLTLDHEMLRQFLDLIDFAPPDQEGTALGMGLASAVNRLRESQARSKVVVLVTDGVNNRGEIGPKAAAEAARALGVKVYAVGVGTEGEALIPVRRGTTGTIQRMKMKVEIDEELLQDISESTDGRYYRATSPEQLQEIFATIDALEKSEIESKVRVLYSELFYWLLIPALLLLLAERALGATRAGRIP